MAELPGFNGPMADWPNVVAMEGAAQALAALAQQYTMVVATNAQQSSAAQVREALTRVELDGYIEQLFTFHELHARKPELQFFESAAKKLGRNPDSLVSIGDSYFNDILPAWRAGCQTVWYNAREETPPGLVPVHAAEIRHLSELPLALERQLHLPSWNTCLAWLLEQRVSARLLAHTLAVAAVAYRLALWLKFSGQQIEPVLVHRAAMLHDIAKLQPTPGIHHGERAADQLHARGQPEIAAIVRCHLLFCLLDEDNRPRSWEQKVVYFADKLVEENQLVRPEQRLDTLQRRYSIDPARIRTISDAFRELHAEICQAIGIPPEDLHERLQQALNQNDRG